LYTVNLCTLFIVDNGSTRVSAVPNKRGRSIVNSLHLVSKCFRCYVFEAVFSVFLVISVRMM